REHGRGFRAVEPCELSLLSGVPGKVLDAVQNYFLAAEQHLTHPRNGLGWYEWRDAPGVLPRPLMRELKARGITGQLVDAAAVQLQKSRNALQHARDVRVDLAGGQVDAG